MAHSLRVQPTMVGKSRWQECEAASHTISLVKKEKERDTGARLAFSSVQTLACGIVPPTFRLDLSTSVH